MVSEFSFASTREVNFGVKNPWAYGTALGLKGGHIYTNESTSDDINIPALEMSYASLSALQYYFQSTTMFAEWVAGDFVNKNLGISAALSGDVDISDRFTKMATTITNYLRYGPKAQSAHGEIIQSESFVSIRWWYFVLPIVTEGLAILFAIFSIMSNRQSRRIPLWKSSALAVLACRHGKAA